MIADWIEKIIALLPPRLQLTARQFMKFFVTGIIGTLVDFSIYTFLTRLLGWTTTYFVFGFEVSAANNVSVFLAIICNFLINRSWTFRAGGGNITRQWSGYFGLNMFTWALNQAFVSLFAFHTPFFQSAFGDNKDLAAKVAAIGIILWINFLGSKFLIFRRQAVR